MYNLKLNSMKQMILAMMIFFFVATVAQAQTAATTDKSTKTEKTDVKVVKTTKCCDHDFVDANHDGKCDKCGMKAHGKSKGNKSDKNGTTANGCSKSCAKSCGGMNNPAGIKPKAETKPSDVK